MKKNKPPWLRKRFTTNPKAAEISRILREHKLQTVCENAHCPNRFECFGKGTATFMILGNVCTRRCRFCAVNKGVPSLPDPGEPEAVAVVSKKLRLQHIVITSVTRDDLDDGGIKHFALTVKAIREKLPTASVEILTPDFKGIPDAAERIAASSPDVFNHNVEVIPRLYPVLRRGAGWDRSLNLLKQVNKYGIITKSSIMVGLGETKKELMEAIKKVRDVGVSILTLGQYLQPTMENHDVVEYITPEQFESLKNLAVSMGFAYVSSGPFVRSSYNAGEAYYKVKRLNI